MATKRTRAGSDSLEEKEKERNPDILTTDATLRQYAGWLPLLLIFVIPEPIGHVGATIFGTIYPAYASFMAIISPAKDDDTQWLTYWVVFAIFSLINEWADIVLSLIPQWYAIEMAILFLLYSPIRGAQVLFDTVLKPIYLQHADRVEDATKEAKGKATSLKQDYLQLLAVHGSAILLLPLAIFFLPNFITRFVCTIVGAIVPALFSIKALITPDKDDDAQWLTYWTIYSLFSTAHEFADKLLFWFPFWYPAELVFVFWLWFPLTKGANVVYSHLLKQWRLLNQRYLKNDHIDGLDD